MSHSDHQTWVYVTIQRDEHYLSLSEDSHCKMCSNMYLDDTLYVILARFTHFHYAFIRTYTNQQKQPPDWSIDIELLNSLEPKQYWT